MLAEAGVEKVQAGLRGVRVLHVLRGLLLIAERLGSRMAANGRRCREKTALREDQKQICFAVPARVAAGPVYE
jgi:hypothetical protein